MTSAPVARKDNGVFRNAEVDRSRIFLQHSTCSSACPLPFIDRLNTLCVCVIPVCAPLCVYTSVNYYADGIQFLF